MYKRIAVADTGSQKLSVHFFDAFKFIGTYVNGFVIDSSPNIIPSGLSWSYTVIGIIQ